MKQSMKRRKSDKVYAAIPKALGVTTLVFGGLAAIGLLEIGEIDLASSMLLILMGLDAYYLIKK